MRSQGIFSLPILNRLAFLIQRK